MYVKGLETSVAVYVADCIIVGNNISSGPMLDIAVAIIVTSFALQFQQSSM